MTAVLAALIVGVVVPACSRDRDRSGPTTSTTEAPATSAPSSTAPASTTTTLPPCPPGPGSDSGNRSAEGSGAVLLTGLVSNHNRCEDSVLIELRGVDGAGPGYETKWVEPPFVEDPSGRTLTVKGKAFLSVRMSPAYGYDFETGEQTYEGAGTVEPPGGGRVQEVVRTGDFEGVLNFVIGLDRKRPFDIVTQSGDSARLEVIFGD